MGFAVDVDALDALARDLDAVAGDLVAAAVAWRHTPGPVAPAGLASALDAFGAAWRAGLEEAGERASGTSALLGAAAAGYRATDDAVSRACG